MIDAAVSARVKRFIPSEFGFVTQQARGTKIGNLVKSKIESVDYLVELSQKHDWFTWTSLSTGSFFDWVSREQWSKMSRDLGLTTYRVSVLASWGLT